MIESERGSEGRRKEKKSVKLGAGWVKVKINELWLLLWSEQQNRVRQRVRYGRNRKKAKSS